MVAGILERIAGLRDERPSAGTRFRLMGLEADITEVVRALQDGVLERVRHEAVLDADADIDFAEASEQVMGMELEEREEQDEMLREQTRRVNEALGGLSEVLAQIDGQLSRRHKDEEYVRLYEAEKRRYLSSGTPRRVRHNFDEWLNNVCYGTPSQDDVNDYVTEKLLHLFEKGVYSAKVEHIQRAKRYPDEFDFDQLASDWAVKDKRLGLKCMVIGMLKDAGVLRGSYNSIAKLLDMEGEKPATLAKYMGMGKKQPFADWIEAYVKSD